MPEALFALGFAFLLAHEMDAVLRREWRLLPGLSLIRDDDLAYRVFTALHVPLYALLLWALVRGGAPQDGVMLGVSAFLIIHAALHVALRNLHGNEFGSLFSWALIGGAGLCGAASLALLL